MFKLIFIYVLPQIRSIIFGMILVIVPQARADTLNTLAESDNRSSLDSYETIDLVNESSTTNNPQSYLPKSATKPDKSPNDIIASDRPFLVNKIEIGCGGEGKNTCIFNANSPEISVLRQSVEGKSLTLIDLKAITDRITQLYVSRGYITSSGNLLPQNIRDGVVVITLIEGGIEDIQVEGLKLVKAEYIKSRIRLVALQPLNQNTLVERLRILQTYSLFKNLEATLKPGKKLGQSILVVKVTEAEAFAGNVSFDNFSPPGVGSEQIGLNINYRNWNLSGDRLNASYRISTTSGSELTDFAYTIPVSVTDDTVQIHTAFNRFKITDAQLEAFNINGRANAYEINYRKPLVRSVDEELGVSVGFSYQDSKTLLADQPIVFGFGSDPNGMIRTSVVKFGQDYIKRDASGLWNLQSSFNFGTGLFNATQNIRPIPDGHFFSWTAQGQRYQQLNNEHLLIATFAAQLTPNSLLSSQQFYTSGDRSVIGFRQNARYGDNGISFAVEDRITVTRTKFGAAVLQLVPFINTAVVWNQSNNPNNIFLPPQNVLAGIGLGLIWNPTSQINVRVDYGLPLVNIVDRGNNLQDSSLYFRASYGF